MKRRWYVGITLHGAALLAALAAHGVDTVIKGARMELVDKGEVVLFSGGVQMDRGTDRLLAREMRTNKGRDKVNIKGNVRMTRLVSATDTWKAWGETGFYNTKDGTGYLVGSTKRAHLERTEILPATGTRTTDIYADRIDFAREGQRAFAQGKVYGKTIDPATGDVLEFTAQEAEHLGEEGRVILTGPTVKPVMTQTTVKGTRRITGKTIIYYTQSRRLITKDGAEAVVTQERAEEKKEK